jgi:hypothetical protein
VIRIGLIVYVSWTVLIGVLGLFSALRHLFTDSRSPDGPHSKLVLLFFSTSAADFALAGAVIWLWWNEVASEWMLLISAILVGGVSTVIKEFFASRIEGRPFFSYNKD